MDSDSNAGLDLEGLSPSLKKLKEKAAQLKKSLHTQEKKLDGTSGAPKPGASASPSGASKRKLPGRKMYTSSTEEIEELRRQKEEVQKKYEQLAAEHQQLKEEADRRMESYMQRSKQYEEKLAVMQGRLNKANMIHEEDVGLAHIRRLNKKIQNEIFALKLQKAQIEYAHDQDLKAWNMQQMMEIKKEVEDKEQQTMMYNMWERRFRDLLRQLEEVKEMAIRLDNQNRQLIKENKNFQMKYHVEVEEKKQLLRELKLFRKDGAGPPTASSSPHLSRANSFVQRTSSPVSDATTVPSSPATTPAVDTQPSADSLPVVPTSPKSDTKRRTLPLTPGGTEAGSPPATTRRFVGKTAAEVEGHYREELRKVRALLKAEQMRHKAVRKQLVQLQTQRTEIHDFLVTALEEAKMEMRQAEHTSSTRTRRAPTAVSTGLRADELRASLGPKWFTEADRVRVVELLLAKDRVIELLYDLAFPQRKPPAPRPLQSEEQSPESVDNQGEGPQTDNIVVEGLTEEGEAEEEDGEVAEEDR